MWWIALWFILKGITVQWDGSSRNTALIYAYRMHDFFFGSWLVSGGGGALPLNWTPRAAGGGVGVKTWSCLKPLGVQKYTLSQYTLLKLP